VGWYAHQNRKRYGILAPGAKELADGLGGHVGDYQALQHERESEPFGEKESRLTELPPGSPGSERKKISRCSHCYVYSASLARP
jgi:hypothetical protein